MNHIFIPVICITVKKDVLEFWGLGTRGIFEHVLIILQSYIPVICITVMKVLSSSYSISACLV